MADKIGPKLGIVRALTSILLTALFAHSCNYHYDRVPKAAGGNSANSNALADQPTDVWLIESVFAPKCASCHNTGRAAAGVNLTQASALSGEAKTSAGKNLLSWGSVETSLLYTITKSGAMPKGDNKLTALELEVLACWITKGKEAARMLSSCRDLTQENSGDSTPPPPVNPTEDNQEDEEEDDEEDEQEIDPPVPIVTAVSFIEVKEKIFDSSCIYCHSTEYMEGDINLESYQAIMDSDKKIIAPTAEESMLYKVVVDGMMPVDSEPLSPELTGLLKRWIDGGAKP